MPVYSFRPETQTGAIKREGGNEYIYVFLPANEIWYFFYQDEEFDPHSLISNENRYEDQKNWIYSDWEVKRNQEGWNVKGKKRLEFTSKFYFIRRLPFSLQLYASRGSYYYDENLNLRHELIPIYSKVGFLPLDFIGEDEFFEFLKNLVEYGGVYVWLQIKGRIEVLNYVSVFETDTPENLGISITSTTRKSVPVPNVIGLTCRKTGETQNFPSDYAVRNRLAAVSLDVGMEINQVDQVGICPLESVLPVDYYAVYEPVGLYDDGAATQYCFRVSRFFECEMLGVNVIRYNLELPTTINPPGSVPFPRMRQDLLVTF